MRKKHDKAFKAKVALESAKRAVEIAIEGNEESAINWLEEQMDIVNTD